MSRRIRVGDVILATGSLLLLVGLLAHVAAAPAVPAPVHKHRHATPGPEVASSPDPAVAATPIGLPIPAAAPDGEPESYAFVPNSRSIKSWKELPVHVVHRPHWVSGRTHPKTPHGEVIDVKLRNAELHLELLGYTPESIRFAFDLVNRLDARVAETPEGGDPVTHLLELARGGPEAAKLAEAVGDGADEESVRVRALAILATHAGSPRIADALAACASSETSAVVRTAAGVSLLWMGREAEVARWVSSEASSKAIADFFESVQVGVNKLEDRRLARTLVFSQVRAVDSAGLVDVLLDGTASARWEPATRARIYSIAAQYGGDRPDVGAWMEKEYARAPDALTRSSILFAAPYVVNSKGLEDRAIEVARTGGPGYLVRTALLSLSLFRTERSMRVLMEVAPKCGEDTARHAIRALERLKPWFGKDVEPFLRTMASGHPDAKFREEAAAALSRSFDRTPR